MYKLYHDKLPPLFHMFERTSNVHNYQTRQPFHLRYVKTLRSQNTIEIKGTKLWNQLSREIDISCAISTFKNKLKTLLISTNFNY